MVPLLCQICYRPSPDVICSQRCQGLKKKKAVLKAEEVRPRILEVLAQLDKDSSICPGRLAKSVLDGLGIILEEERDALSLLRETLYQLRAEGQLRFFQKNILVPRGKGPWDIKGPFRVKKKA